MQLIGAVLVFLGLVCAGFLGGIFVVLVRLARSRDKQHAEAIEGAERHHRALRSQLTETSATILERAHLVGAALAAEIRAMAAAHRNDLRLAMRLPPLRVPGEAPREEAPPPQSLTRASSPATPAPSSTTQPSAPPLALTVDDEDPTPPSGWSLEQLRAHTAGPDLNDTEPRR